MVTCKFAAPRTDEDTYHFLGKRPLLGEYREAAGFSLLVQLVSSSVLS